MEQQLQYDTKPTDTSSMENLIRILSENNAISRDTFSKSQQAAENTRAKQMELIERLMKREDNASTGNPFIDMLNGYKNFRKSRDPNYKWQGLVGAIANKLDKRKANKLAQYQYAIDNPVLPYSPDRDKYAGQSTLPTPVPPPQAKPWIAAPTFPQGGLLSTLPQFDREPPHEGFSSPDRLPTGRYGHMLTSSSAITNPPYRTATNSFLDLIKSMPKQEASEYRGNAPVPGYGSIPQQEGINDDIKGFQWHLGNLLSKSQYWKGAQPKWSK